VSDSRPGDSFWYPWDGQEYEQQLLNPYIYQTEGHVDLENETVRKALASAIQRDGISYSIGAAYGLVDQSVHTLTYGGAIGGDHVRAIVDYETGLSIYSQEPTEDIVELTIVELPVGDS
jgi:hypothetical protein